MLHETSVASTRSSAFEPGLRVVAVADPEALDEQAVLLGLRLLLVRRVDGVIAPEPSPAIGGDDLEDGAGHVAAQRRARQQRLGGVVAQRLEVSPAVAGSAMAEAS